MTRKQLALLRCNVGKVLYATPLDGVEGFKNKKLLIYRELTADPENSPLFVAQFSYTSNDNDFWDLDYHGPMKPVP